MKFRIFDSVTFSSSERFRFMFFKPTSQLSISCAVVCLLWYSSTGDIPGAIWLFAGDGEGGGAAGVVAFAAVCVLASVLVA